MNAKRQLISADEAIPAKAQHRRPCSDCPLGRASLPGWLGGATSVEYLLMLHTDAKVDCHVLAGVQCAGVAIYRANVAKNPRDPAVLRLSSDRVAVFAKPSEFLAHHDRPPAKKSG